MISNFLTGQFFIKLFIAVVILGVMVWAIGEKADVVHDAAREAAREASVNQDFGEVEEKAYFILREHGFQVEAASVDINFFHGDMATVTVQYNYPLYSFKIPESLGGAHIEETIPIRKWASFERYW